jgi:hypothetical protein
LKLTSSLKLVKPTPDLFAVACIATLLTAAGLLGAWRLSDDSQARTDAFGASLASGLAQLTIEPLLKQNRIALGVLGNRTLALPEVAGIQVLTIDDQVLVASGQVDQGLRYTRPVTFDDSIMGYVRVYLNPPAANTATFGWLLAILGVVLAPPLAVVAFSLRIIARPAAVMPPATAIQRADGPEIPEETEAHHLVAVNLYNQFSMTPAARKLELDHAFAIAEQVANLYLGEVQQLPGTGLLVNFPAGDDPDRALQILCATFVLAELLAQYQADDAGSYRLGLHTVEIPVGQDLQSREAQIGDVALLSALAKHLTVAVSGSFPIQTLQSHDQVFSHSLRHPLLDELGSVASALLVTGLSATQQTLVIRQVERLSTQWGSTASESTF